MLFAAAGLNRQGWDTVLDEMTSYGLDVSAADRAKIVDYLSGYLGSPVAPNQPAPAPR